MDLPRSNGDTLWDVLLPEAVVIAPTGVAWLAFVDPDDTRDLEPAATRASPRARDAMPCTEARWGTHTRNRVRVPDRR